MMRRRFSSYKQIYPDSAPNGVYAVTKDIKLLPFDKGNNNCIGISLIKDDHRFMIEKNEYSNQSYKDAAAGKDSTYEFYWGGYGTDQAGITNYVNAYESTRSGYLKTEGGSYNGTPNLPDDISLWTSGSLSDWQGKANSGILKGILTGDESNTSYATIGHVLNTFLASQDAKGFDDWYIPSCGQLSLIFMSLMSINKALYNIGGLQMSNYMRYWSSSEYSNYAGWFVSLEEGRVNYNLKIYTSLVRFILDIK